jgi:ankyrin repeat protein
LISPTTPRPRTPEEQAVLDNSLIDAAWANDVTRVRQLIAEGANVNVKDSTQQSAYLIATSEGYLDLLELTLAAGAELTALDRFGGTGLIRAAERGHAAVVGRLLGAGISVDHVNRPGFTALHEAVIYGDGSQRYVDTVRLLVARGADVRLTPVQDGIAPVEHARARGQDAVVATLQAALTLPVPADPGAALLQAAAEGDADRAALTLRAGAPLEVQDERGRTPLLLAATHDRVDVARLLVALGADPDALDDGHDTPWLVTGVTGSVPMLEALMPAGPDLAIQNRFGGVSVIPAAERGHVDYVRRVVQTGIDVDHVNDPGWTALLEAVSTATAAQGTRISSASSWTPEPTPRSRTGTAVRPSTRPAPADTSRSAGS